MKTGLQKAEDKIQVCFQTVYAMLMEYTTDDIVYLKNHLAVRLKLLPRGQHAALIQFSKIEPLHDRVSNYITESMFNYKDAFQLDSGKQDELGQTTMLTFLPAMVFCKIYNTKGSTVGHIAHYMLDAYLSQITNQEQTTNTTENEEKAN